MDRLPLLKALGDNTRYAIYLELARSARPLATAEVAESLGLHANTVRPHLERMRDVGLLDVEVDARGTVGRPQHRYSVAADAPSLGLEPPAFPMLASMLASVAAAARPAGDDVAESARPMGRVRAESLAVRPTDAESCVTALLDDLAALGFDPEVAAGDDETTVAFTRCPYRELAEAFPDLVCHLHRGMVEGFTGVLQHVDAIDFHTLVDRQPCQVSLAGRYPQHPDPSEEEPVP